MEKFDKVEIANWFDGSEFEALSDLWGARVVYRCYNTDYYEGDAVVVYVKQGKWFVAESSHCSCNGMDWDPQETTREKLLAKYKGKPYGDARDVFQALEDYHE